MSSRVGKVRAWWPKRRITAAQSITEERTGELKDYSRHQDKPLASFVFVNDPELRDAGKLWNFYDAHETRKNAQHGMTFDRFAAVAAYRRAAGKHRQGLHARAVFAQRCCGTGGHPPARPGRRRAELPCPYSGSVRKVEQGRFR